MENQHLATGGDPIPINTGPIAAKMELLNYGTWSKILRSYGTNPNTGSGGGECSPSDGTHRPQPDDEEQLLNPTTKRSKWAALPPNSFDP